METHILFFILAGTLIVILVCYSLWSARREKSRIDTFAVRPVSAPVGSQQARPGMQTPAPSAPSAGFNTQSPLAQEIENSEQWVSQQQEIESQVQEIKIKLADQTPIEETEKPIFVNEPEPQVNIQMAEAEPVLTIQQAQISAFENNLVTLYVVAAQGCEFSGMAVVQQLEALGLQYGEYQIFHRHLDHSNSPVLFSAANMMQPGVFELETIEQFSTVGLVFFMQLPSPTNDTANLRIMINTVESFAQALGGFILNDQHQLFDEAARQDYFSRLQNA